MRSGTAGKTIRGLATALLIVGAGAVALPSYAGRLLKPDAPAAAQFASPAATTAISAKAAGSVVVEYYHGGLDHFFITSDPIEQAAVDSGAAGAWQRTSNTFFAGGPSQVCRFYGNTAINPATGAIFGPNSHFYTADATECASLKAQFNPNAKSWKFESNDFLITPAVNRACPAGLVPVYRAYNNGFAKGIDSNHRITSSLSAYQQSIASGWVGEGIVMCAPQAQGGILPPQLAACGADDCPVATELGSGPNLVNVIVEIINTTTSVIEIIIPAGQTFIAIPNTFQDGLSIEALRATIAPGTTGRFVLHLFCMHQDRHASATDAKYAPGPITANAQLLDLVALASGKLGKALDPVSLKASAMQFAVWEITNGRGSLGAASRNLLVALLAAAADDLMTQATLLDQFQATLTQPG